MVQMGSHFVLKFTCYEFKCFKLLQLRLCNLIVQVAELKMNAEQDKAQLLRDFHTEKELLYTEKERDVEHVRESLKRELEDTEKRGKEKSSMDAKVC